MKTREQKLIYFERVEKQDARSMEIKEVLATYLTDRWQVMNIVGLGGVACGDITTMAFVGGAALILLEREERHEDT